MSITSFFKSLFGRKAEQAPQAVNKPPKRTRAGVQNTYRQFPWLDQAMASIKRPGNYIIHPPADEKVDVSQTRICGRLQARFGKGKYSTKRLRLEGGGYAIAVYIPARRRT